MITKQTTIAYPMIVAKEDHLFLDTKIGKAYATISKETWTYFLFQIDQKSKQRTMIVRNAQEWRNRGSMW